MADRQAVAHLLRRATFGPTAAEVDAAEAAGVEATLAGLLNPTGTDSGAAGTPPPILAPLAPVATDATSGQKQAATAARREEVQVLSRWWLTRMVAAQHQLTEKMVFFWHGHWATSVQKVKSAALMLNQLETMRRTGYGDFALMLKAILRDPALIIWLDGQRNTKQAPNENLARELMELFTLGIGAYTEEDVRQGARALTGWTIDRTTLTAVVQARRRDDGVKTILGRSADFDVDSYADLLVAQPAHPVHLARRLWFRFGSGADPGSATESRLISGYGPGRDVTGLLRALFSDEAFPATHGQLVKQPVEWIVGAVRQLDLLPAIAAPRQLLNGLNALGQVPLQPPSVGGWPAGAAWLTTASAQARVRVATALAQATGRSILDSLATGDTAARLAALARLLVVDAWTERSAAALRDAAREPRQLLTVGLATPEYSIT